MKKVKVRRHNRKTKRGKAKVKSHRRKVKRKAKINKPLLMKTLSITTQPSGESQTIHQGEAPPEVHYLWRGRK